MDTWTSIPYSAAKKVIEGVKQMDIVRKKTFKEILKWRDEKLRNCLKLYMDKGLLAIQQTIILAV